MSYTLKPENLKNLFVMLQFKPSITVGGILHSCKVQQLDQTLPTPNSHNTLPCKTLRIRPHHHLPPLIVVADDLDNVTMTMLQGDHQAVNTFAVFPPQHVLILAQNGGGEQDFYDVNVTMLAGFKQCLERNCGVETVMG